MSGFSREEGLTDMKDQINDLVVLKTLENLKHKKFYKQDYYSMYLDGQNARTTNKFLKANIKPEKLIPVNSDYEICLDIQKIAPNVVNDQLANVISDKDGLKCNSFASIWFDYCCTWDGTEKCSPKEDLKQALKYYVTKGTFIGITVSLRDRRIKGSRKIYVKRIVKEIKQITKVDKIKKSQYSKNMCFLSFNI
jgi:hypothetical protein